MQIHVLVYINKENHNATQDRKAKQEGKNPRPALS